MADFQTYEVDAKLMTVNVGPSVKNKMHEHGGLLEFKTHILSYMDNS
jgi:hypothetical protein